VKDVIIVGAGPSGLACAIEAEKSGLDYLVIEKGCVVNSIQRYPVQMTFFTTPELLEIGGLPFVSGREKPTRIEGLKYYRRVADTYHLKIHLYETVLGICQEKEGFLMNTRTHAGEERQYQSSQIVLATGYYDIPNLLNIPGENLPKVYRAGAHVTLVHWRKELSSSIKYWIKPDIENRIKSGEISAHFETAVTAITPSQVFLRHFSGQCLEIPNDFVFAMTGYRPDVEFFKSIGLKSIRRTRSPHTTGKILKAISPGSIWLEWSWPAQ
jgi:thioredoxin reductase (NADPH)